MNDFNELLNEYKNQYALFLNSGDKTGYQNAYNAIEEAIASKQANVSSEKRNLAHFADSYQKTNTELNGVSDTTQRLVKDAQDIHDEYNTSKQRYDTWTESTIVPPSSTVDVSVGYSIMLRLGIFLILLPVLVLAGYFVPDLYGTSLTAASSSNPIASFLSPKQSATPFSPILRSMSSPLYRPWGY